MENMVAPLNTLQDFYRGKRVLLTGHTGFKGSWMLKLLSMLKADIKGYALSPQGQSNLYEQVHGDTLCTSVIGDIRDYTLLANEVDAFQPDLVFHLAAQPLVRASYERPVETFDINAMGTANLLNSIRQLQKPCAVVIITTDKVYYNNEWVYPYRENDRLGGYDPYSASKACAELIVDSYRNSFFNTHDFALHHKAIAVARAGNVIGGGDWAEDRIIPDIVRALSIGQPILVRNPFAIRPWQHVLEPLYGYLLLGMKLAEYPAEFSEAYNFGPSIDDTLTVEELVQNAIEIWGYGTYSVASRLNALHEAGLLRLDVTKAITELDWQPRWTSLQALAHTLNWYKAQLETGESSKQTEEQILQFYGHTIA